MEKVITYLVVGGYYSRSVLAIVQASSPLTEETLRKTLAAYDDVPFLAQHRVAKMEPDERHAYEEKLAGDRYAAQCAEAAKHGATILPYTEVNVYTEG